MSAGAIDAGRGSFFTLVVAEVLLGAAGLWAALPTQQGDAALLRGVHEITLEAFPGGRNPYFDVDFQVRFTRPNETQVTVDGFYDGGRTFRARAYCDAVGLWRWQSVSNVTTLNGRTGQFHVVPSDRKGKLRRHRDDPRQLAYDNGQWFLHIGDTGYRYVTDTEPQWKAYVDQAARVGFTKIRTWFCQGRGDVQVLFSENRAGMNLPYWREIDRRLTYALNHHPHVIFQLMPYGEDTAEIARYGQGDRAAVLVGKYAQARFSAFPNVHWCLTNDRHIVSREPMQGRDASPRVINKMGLDFRRREPWGTLLTNHQMRRQGYHFTDAPWSDIVTLEDVDQVAGGLILHYRTLTDDPVILDEDRYELYIPPERPRYFFRRLMWASLLSGGGATYGGLKTYEPYDGELSGVQGYDDAVRAGKLVGGAQDFRYIHQFFQDTGVTLARMEPADAMVGYQPHRFKCIRDADHIIVYLQNPDSAEPQKAQVSSKAAAVKVHLPPFAYEVRWFEPTTGRWVDQDESKGIWDGVQREFKAPFSGDAILFLRRRS